MTAPSTDTGALSGDAGPVRKSARRWWALVAMAASVLVVGLDVTVLNLALPSIASSLGASTGDLQWVADAYTLVIAAAILPAGLMGDRYGRKRLLLIALVLFGFSSVWCAYAPTTGELIAARAVLGVGAAAIFPLSLSVIPVLFAPEEQQKAIAFISGSIMLSFPIGPVLGGYLLDHYWWGSVFLINAPVVVLAILAVAFLMPESRSSVRRRVDVLGVLISSAGLAGLTYGFIRAGQYGWHNRVAVATIAGGVVVLALFVGWERLLTGFRRGSRSSRTEPLVELGLFRSNGFRWGTTLVTLVSFAMFGVLFAIPQYFQEVLGASALGSGMRMLPFAVGMVVGMGVGARLQSRRRGGRPPVARPKTVVALGYIIMAAAMAVGAYTKLSSTTEYSAEWIAAVSLGLGLAMPSAMTIAIGALSAERSGSGSAVVSALRQVGATIGVAVLGTMISNGYATGVDTAGLPASAAAAAKSSVAGGVAVAGKLRSPALLHSVRTAYIGGMDTMLWAGAGIAVVSALLAMAFLRQSKA